jgi:elongation factor P
MADNSALLRNGNKILIDNEPYLILDNSFVNPGKGQAFTKVRIRNLLNKKVI